MASIAEQALEAAGIGAWDFDIAASRLSWTPLASAIHGLDPGQSLPLGSALDFYPPDARPIIEAAIQEGIRSGAPWDLELPFVTARGRRLWVRTCGRAIREGGKTVRLYGAFEDITARRELAEREARLSIIARQMSNAVIMADRDGRTEWLNDAFTRLTGYTIEDFRGRPPGELLQGPESDPNTVRIMGDGIRSGAGFDVEIVNYTKDRRPYWMAVTCSPLRDAAGQLSGFIAVETDVTARRAAEEKARREAAERERAEALLRDILDTLPSAVTAFDAEGRLILSNSAYAEMFPISARFAVPGRRLEDIIRLAADHGQYADVPTAPAEREAWITDNVARFRSSGSSHILRLADGHVVQVRERQSATGTIVCVRTDTTDLQRAEALLRDVLDALPSAVMAYDKDERLILLNRSYADLFPIAARHAVPGRKLEDFLRLNATDGQFPDAGATPEAIESWVAEHLALFRAPGKPRTLHLRDGRFVLARDSRSETGNLVCVRTDTTDLKRAEADLRFQAERDPLTRLANRTAFLAALDRALGSDPDGHLAVGALLLLDIDYFKQINDSFGHDMGDALLVEIAARLGQHLRAGDAAGRLGGDEFGVLIPGLADPGTLAMRVEALHAALSLPADLAGRRVPVGISVGLTVFPADGTDAAQLLKNADLALYEAKRNGRGRWAVFQPAQTEALAQHVHLADALRRALAQNQMTVALQPKRLLRGGHAGFEALARWHDGDRWVPPGEFIPVAVDTGLIGPLGRAVLDAALARMRHIRDRGHQPGRVAVNVTGTQLLEANFQSDTIAALRRHGLRPSDLELELTETDLFGRAAERIDAVLRALSDLGVTIALDDFGTGYASLAHLSRLPIERLKIDRSFVADIGAAGPGGVIVRAVVSLAHSLGMDSIAEGVETDEQLAFLDAAGCDAAQGYLFSLPLLTAAEAIDYLRAQNRTAAARPPRAKAQVARG